MNKLTLNTLLLTLIVGILYAESFFFFDQRALLYVSAHPMYHLTEVASWFTALANGTVWSIVVVVALLFLFWHRHHYGATKFNKNFSAVVFSVVFAIMIGEACKYLLARYRPIEFLEHGVYGFHFLSHNYFYNSTPSGHTFRIFSLLTALSLIWRKMWIPFMLLAICVGLSRVILMDHYPSDIVFGAYVGILTAMWTRSYLSIASARARTSL